MKIDRASIPGTSSPRSKPGLPSHLMEDLRKLDELYQELDQLLNTAAGMSERQR